MSAGKPITLSVEAARRFHRRAAGLDAPHENVGAALAHHGYVQIDPINVCGRMHDLILRNRVSGYAEGDLMRFVHGVHPRESDDAGDSTSPKTKPLSANRRAAFEYYFPERGILVAHEAGAWRYLNAWLRERKIAKKPEPHWLRFSADERAMADDLLSEMARRGPLSGDDIGDKRRAMNNWGVQSSLAKTTLDKLFLHRRVLIARRGGNGARRVYDLPERLLPAKALRAKEADADEAARWFALLKLRQHRLVALKKNEIALVEDAVRAVRIEGCAMLHVLREDVELLERLESGKRQDATSPLLLAPLDPLIYDRRLTSGLWGFDYTWEVYTPQTKRVRGYYALPVLSGLDFVGHIDPKADRKGKRLVVMSRSVRRGHNAGDAVKGLARFLGLK